METIKIACIDQRPSWTSVIVALDVGCEFKADYSKLNTISPLISGRIKMMYPDREYKTRKFTEKAKKKTEKDKHFLIVKRIK